jgi:hypothetical protein
MKQKNQKPIEVDAYLKYRCPLSKCGYDHWLSLKETKTKNFKIVCECGSILIPKQISKLNIVYTEDNSVSATEPPEQIKIIEKPKIPIDFKNNCVRVLVGYGFTKEESIDLCEKAFEKNPVNSSGLLIKYILQNLEELNVNN